MSTLIELLEDAARRYGEHPALVLRTGLRDERWSYERLWQASGAVAACLRHAHGLREGERVLLCAPNQPRLVAALLGTMRARLVPVPLDPFTTPEFAAHVAADTGAVLCIAGQPLELPGVAQLALAQLPVDGAPAAALEPPAPADIAEIVYTSGTTGRPKGVVLTHANIWSNVLAAEQLIPHADRWRLISLLPLSHMLEQTVGLYAQLRHGSTMVYGVAHHPAAIGKAMRRYHVSALVVVPQVLVHMLQALEQEVARRGMRAWWNLQQRVAARLPMAARRVLWRRVLRELGGALEVVMCGGARLPADLAQSWERLGIPVVQGYGATECAPIIASNTMERRVPDSAGRAVAGVELRLATDGEVQVRGPSVTPGYWRNDEATRAAFTPDGWYRTGDLGEIDAAGDLYLKGRLKDMVVLPSGLNVFLEDLEGALGRQPGVRACIVLDVPRPAGGRAFTGVVIGECTETAMHAANTHLAPHQHLSALLPWDGADFPRTTLGKVKRAEVRAWLERSGAAQAAAAGAPAAAETPAAKLAQLLSEVSGVEAQRIRPETSLAADLALDSLARVELALAIEARLGVVLDDGMLGDLQTVAQLTELLGRDPGTAPRAAFPEWPLRAPARALRALLQRLLLFPLHALLARPFRVLRRDALRALDLPALFIANHASHADTVSILRALPPQVRGRLAVAAAADYFYRYRAIGWLTSLLLNTFPFSREGAVRASLERCGELADRGWSVLIYPEGTRSPSGALLPFKSGIGLLACGLGVPIVPVAVLGGHDVLPKGRRLPRPAPMRVLFGTALRLPPDCAPADAVARLHQAVAALMRAAANPGGDA